MLAGKCSVDQIQILFGASFTLGRVEHVNRVTHKSDCFGVAGVCRKKQVRRDFDFLWRERLEEQRRSVACNVATGWQRQLRSFGPIDKLEVSDGPRDFFKARSEE